MCKNMEKLSGQQYSINTLGLYLFLIDKVYRTLRAVVCIWRSVQHVNQLMLAAAKCSLTICGESFRQKPR